MEHTNTFMGVTTRYNPVAARKEMQEKAERGLITPRAYWTGLKAAWYEMVDADKAEELAEINI